MTAWDEVAAVQVLTVRDDDRRSPAVEEGASVHDDLHRSRPVVRAQRDGRDAENRDIDDRAWRWDDAG